MMQCPTREVRLRPGDDVGAALLISLITILVAMSLSIAVLGSVVSQLGPAQFGMKNTRTVHAAEAGLDTALGMIRTALVTDPADNTRTVGDRRLLPCTAGTRAGTVNGNVAGSPGNLRYAVTINYFSQDPAGQGASWRTANALPCSSSGGPTTTPFYAVISSTGTGTGAGAAAGPDVATRNLETVYDLRVTNTNRLGGLIHTYFDGDAGTRDLCLDAGSAMPADGDPVTVQPCSPDSVGQAFSWRSDYSLVLSSTQGASASGGMCIRSVPVAGTDYAFMQTCDSTFLQKWGYSDNGRFFLQPRYNPPSSMDTSRACLYVVSDNTPGSRVATTGAPCSGDYTRTSTWNPDARVGAGRAGSEPDPVVDVPMQWVNFEEFGRCVDVTGQDPTIPFMIAFPCKQDPAGSPTWNQTLAWTGPTANGQLYTVFKNQGQTFAEAAAAGGVRKCMLAPPANGGYVRLADCDTTNPRYTWTVNRATGVYATTHTVVDVSGRCLSLGPPITSTGSLAAWSTIITETCNGSTRQKWNAPPWISLSGLRDTLEGAG